MIVNFNSLIEIVDAGGGIEVMYRTDTILMKILSSTRKQLLTEQVLDIPASVMIRKILAKADYNKGLFN